MTVLDANVLLYAYQQDAPEQRAVARWLQKLINGGQTVGLPWVTLWAFCRVSTNARVWSVPLAPPVAFRIVREWLDNPSVRVVEPGPRHLEVLQRLVIEAGATGSKMSDAVLAALAIEHGAAVASTDHDFRRFAGVRWVNPLA